MWRSRDRNGGGRLFPGVLPEMKSKEWDLKPGGNNVPDSGEEKKNLERPKGKWKQSGKWYEEWNLEIY